MIGLTQILQLAAKSAQRAEALPFGAKFGVNPDKNAPHFASAEGKFCSSKIWVEPCRKISVTIRDFRYI